MSKYLLMSFALAAAALAPGAYAATAWNEALSGDLANLGSAPTAVTLGVGSNLIIGSTGRNPSGVVDRDYFSFTVAPGLQLDAITLLPATTFLGPESISFIAIQAGPRVTVDPLGNNPAGLLGWWLYSENDINTDILQLMGGSPGAVGYSGALPAGRYSVWVQETSPGVARYSFDFQISPVPEPAAALFMLAGLAALGWRTRRS